MAWVDTSFFARLVQCFSDLYLPALQKLALQQLAVLHFLQHLHLRPRLQMPPCLLPEHDGPQSLKHVLHLVQRAS